MSVLKFFEKKSNFIFFLILVSSCILEVLFRLSERFAEFFCMYISPVFKLIFLPANLFPFALSETLVIFAAVLVSAVAVISVLKLFFKNFLRAFSLKKFLSFVLKCTVVVIALFTVTFSASYHRVPIYRHLEIETAITEYDIEQATRRAAEELAAVAEFVSSSDLTGTSDPNMNLSALFEEVEKEVNRTAEKYGFYQKTGVRAKPLALSVPLTYTHIAGIYTFFTGEPCINTNYANYTLPYTVAHEYSHQRGIAPEDEADFSAFLILSQAENPYLRYSAWAEAFILLANELYEFNPEAYYEILPTLPDIVLYDYYSSSQHYSKYSNSAVSEIAETVNDTYLKANGVESGVKSYSQSLILITSYINSKF